MDAWRNPGGRPHSDRGALLTNLLQPLLLARVVSGIAVAALVLYGVFIAAQVVRHWRVASLAEGQLALERRAELVATIVQAALVLCLANLALTVVAADHLADAIAGAMCAWGVFGSTAAGFPSLAVTWAAAAAATLWVVVHRLDLRMTRATLTRGKFLALFALAPLLLVDLGLATGFALELDLSVVATCCSASLDAGGGSPFLAGALLDAPVGRGVAGALAALLAAGAAGALAARRRPGRAGAFLVAGLSLLGGVLALPAVTGYVAPHAYETPGHACPFCLLHGDVFGIGWPLFGALFFATVLGLAVGLVEGLAPRVSEPEEARSQTRRLAGWSAASWVTVLVVAAWPVARWAVLTSGAPLFGGGAG